MEIANLSSNVVVISCNWLAVDGGTFGGQVTVQPGGCIQADVFSPVNGGLTNGTYVDDGLHGYVGIVDAGGHQSCVESWSLLTVGFEGFWWGIGLCAIPCVIWFAKKGARGGLSWWDGGGG